MAFVEDPSGLGVPDSNNPSSGSGPGHFVGDGHNHTVVGSIPGIGNVVFPVSGHGTQDIGSVIGDPRDGGHRSHKGVDIFAPSSTGVVSAVDGVIVRIGFNSLGGERVTVQDSQGNTHYYAHLSGYASGLEVGTQVQAGQLLGYVGQTGNAASTSAHLHYSINEGSGRPLVDPEQFLSDAQLVTVPSANQVESEHEAGGGVGGNGFNDGGPLQVPDNGRIVDVEGQRWLVYIADYHSSNLQIGFKVDRDVDLSNVWEGGAAQQMSADQFQTEILDGGSVGELPPIRQGYGSFQNFYQQTLDLILGTNPAAEDPSVQRVILEYVGRPDMSDIELQNRLEQTEWYQQRTQQQLEFNDLSEAEQGKRVQDQAARLAQLFFTYTGESLPVTDAQLQQWAMQVASGEIGEGFWVETVAKERALLNPESPHARRLRDEEENQRRRAIETENLVASTRALANRWGVQLTDETLQDWGQGLVSQERSQDDLVQYLKQQAQVLYPGKDPELETRLYVEPWLQVYRRTLEQEADIFNPKVQQAIQGGLTPFDLEQQLRQSDEFLGTSTARDEFTSAATSIGRAMGFN